MYFTVTSVPRHLQYIRLPGGVSPVQIFLALPKKLHSLEAAADRQLADLALCARAPRRCSFESAPAVRFAPGG